MHIHTKVTSTSTESSVISLQELFRSYYTPKKQKSSSLLSWEVKDWQKGEETMVCYEGEKVCGQEQYYWKKRFKSEILLTWNGETFFPPTIRAAVCPLYSSLDRCFTTWQSCTWERYGCDSLIFDWDAMGSAASWNKLVKNPMLRDTNSKEASLYLSLMHQFSIIWWLRWNVDISYWTISVKESQYCS